MMQGKGFDCGLPLMAMTLDKAEALPTYAPRA